MNFSFLTQCHTQWRDILVIGKTVVHDGKNIHIIGMTLADEAKLYMIEPYHEPEPPVLRGVRNQRRIQKESTHPGFSYLSCSKVRLGETELSIRGGSAGPLQYSLEDWGVIQVFLDMLSAGWAVPDWLADLDWSELALVTLDVPGLEKLPDFSSEMSGTLTVRPDPVRHLIEKPVTLTVGKPRTLHFLDQNGSEVECHINNVTLIDVWAETEQQFNDPRYAELVTPEQIAEIRKSCFETLAQNCPRGMCYVGVEYECSRDMSLQFYSREFLRSVPEPDHGSASIMMMRLKPDRETGSHGLPLRGCAIETPVPPDTTKLAAELFSASELIPPWEERIP